MRRRWCARKCDVTLVGWLHHTHVVVFFDRMACGALPQGVQERAQSTAFAAATLGCIEGFETAAP